MQGLQPVQGRVDHQAFTQAEQTQGLDQGHGAGMLQVQISLIAGGVAVFHGDEAAKPSECRAVGLVVLEHFLQEQMIAPGGRGHMAA